MTVIQISLSLILLGIPALSNLYSPESDVDPVTIETFFLYLNEKPFTVVQFYSQFCIECRKFAKNFQQAATLLKGIIGFAAVNCDKQAQLRNIFRISTYPSTVFFRGNETDGLLYDGSNILEDIMNFAFDRLSEILKDRIRKKGMNWTLDHEIKFINAKSQECDASHNGTYGENSSVINLTGKSFYELILDSEDQWLVEFYADCCPKCIKLKSHWEISSISLRGKMKLAAINASEYKYIADKLSIKEFPKIKYFPTRARIWDDQTFNGGQWSDSIIFWATNVWSQNKPAADVIEITNSSVIHKACYATKLCMIAIMPKLVECGAKCRNNYLSIMANVSRKFRHMDWGWIWTESETHPQLEYVLDIEGYENPTLLAVKVKKSTCKILTNRFNNKGVTEFAGEIISGIGTTPEFSIGNLPDVKSVDSWDGKNIPVTKKYKKDVHEVKTEL